MEMNSGLIKNGESPVAQVQLVNRMDGMRTVKLYTANGIFLCEQPFEGDDDLGHLLGLALYTGYSSGYLNAEINARSAIEKAFRDYSPTKV